MDLSIEYMGLKLKHPFMPGASPLVDDMDVIRRLEDAGASAIVMHSLFEEQLLSDQLATTRAMEEPAESFGEATTYLPPTADWKLGPEEYLAQIARIKGAVAVPVIGSLNGVTPGGWIEHGRLIEQAGADAIELNMYQLATDPGVSGQRIEENQLEIVSELRKQVKLPIAVKLSPFYSSIANFAQQLAERGADGVVLFNRFYQPDIDLENLEVMRLNLSSASELLLRLRWVAVLHGRINASLAVTGGVHGPADAIKSVMTGASAVQVVSALLANGPDYLKHIIQGVSDWLEENEYESLAQLHGSMSLLKCPDPSIYERANYARILQSWTDY